MTSLWNHSSSWKKKENSSFICLPLKGIWFLADSWHKQWLTITNLWGHLITSSYCNKSHFPSANSIHINSPIYHWLLLLAAWFWNIQIFWKDYCQHTIGKLLFQFPTHVLEGPGAIHATKCKWSLLLSAAYKSPDIFLSYSSRHVCQEKKKKKNHQKCRHSRKSFYILLKSSSLVS